MITLPGHENLIKIYESASSLVYRGQRRQDALPIILKILKETHPQAGELTRYRREYTMTRNLADVEGIVKVCGIKQHRNTLVMCFEDFGGQSLASLLHDKQRAFRLDELLAFAIRITEILGDIHQHNIIHKDINPSNILVNPSSGVLKIIDFGIATQLSTEHLALKHPNVLEGTLAYMSPEQTGRMNRVLDYRSDFYSLGATLYEIFTGIVPFDTTDALESVHSHIAKSPPPPERIRPDLPPMLVRIIMKLLEKTAEARYQSAWGLQYDLQACQDALNETGTIELFSLSRHDMPSRFQIPQKLYGREHEIATLNAAFERAASGSAEMMLIAGYSGIGKSVLVQEIYRSLVTRQGYFISGKFDQFQQTIPYSAVVAAFGELVQQLLTEDEYRLRQWKHQILSALGPNGHIVIDVIPEIELIIGPQPPVPQLDPTESQHRFHLAFQNFIRVFCQPDHPLVLFLDDLQWVDSATLGLLERIMTDHATCTLFVIGAYRDNEVDPTHPLMRALEKLRETPVTLNLLTLQPLTFDDMNQLVTESLHHPPETVDPLTDIVIRKTGGNPFFANQFLHTLYEKGGVRFIPPTHEQEGCWQWDLGRITTLNITDNVVELMIDKLKSLPVPAQNVLRLAACMGNHVDLDSLSVIYERSAAETYFDLAPALKDGLLLPTSDPEITGNNLCHSPLTVGHVRFLHDRVQQAAYALIDDAQKQAVHLQIGRLLLQNSHGNVLGDNVFDIAEHFNQSLELLNNPAERLKVARINLQAGQKAKTATAYGAAVTYFTVGRECLPDNRWNSEYDLTLKLYTEAAEAAYLNGDFVRMEQLACEGLQEARTLSDEAGIWIIRILAHVAQGQQRTAISTALRFLRRLGVHLPDEPTQEDVETALKVMGASLSDQPIQALADLPIMTSDNMVLATRIIMVIIPAAFFASPKLMILLVLKQVELSLKYGNISESSYCYVCYGFILCGIVGDIEAGYQFGQLALDLLKRFDEKALEARVIEVFNGHIRFWKDHLKDTLPPLLKNYQTSLNSGDIEYAGYSIFMLLYHSYFSGKPLGPLEQEIAQYDRAGVQLKQEHILYWNRLLWQVVLNLRGAPGTPGCLSGKAYDENIQLPRHQYANDRLAIHVLHLHKCILHYLFHQYVEAVENAAVATRYVDGVTSMMAMGMFYFYDSLARLAVCHEFPQHDRETVLKHVATNQEKLRHWAQHAPINFQHKWYLVEAEQARVLGRDGDARELYDQAIALSHEHEYLSEEALAYELAGRFYLSKNHTKFAQVYLYEAYYAYQRWGAAAKVTQLETLYPEYLAHPEPTKRGTTGTASSTTRSLPDIDSIFKASRAISGEIVLENLLSRLMEIVLENAGAQRGVLLLEENGHWRMAARSDIEQPEPYVAHSGTFPIVHPVEEERGDDTDASLFPRTVVNYVIRSREHVVLDNASHDPRYVHDRYIHERQPASVVCLPLLNRGKLSGVLYLENNLITGAFTPNRIAVLDLLASQAAISIENARLYQKYRSLYENSVEGIFQTTPDGRLLSANPALADILGYASPEDLLASITNIPQQVFVNPDDRSSNLEHLDRDGMFTGVEAQLYRKDYTIIWASISARAIKDIHGKPLYYEGSLSDVTARKEREKSEKEREAAEAANQAKSQFLANMSHELRTPLNSILGFAQLMARTACTDDERENLAVIQRSGEHLLTLINQVLDLSKIEAGRTTLNAKIFDLHDLLDDVHSMFSLRAQHRGVCLTFTRDDNVPRWVCTDEVKLRQVLINLLNNAIKFTQEGKVELCVNARSNGVMEYESNGEAPSTPTLHYSNTPILHFTISDTGPGIAPEEMAMLFEPFAQTEIGKQAQEGTGLGLPISRKFVRLMGGDITVTSVVGQSTTFTFEIQAGVVDEQAMPQTQNVRRAVALQPGQRAADGTRYRLLIVDDNPDNRQLLIKLLQPFVASPLRPFDKLRTLQAQDTAGSEQSFELREAENGQEAINIWTSWAPHLIWMDLRMPVLDGYKAVRQIKSSPQGKQAIVIIMSASVIDEDRIAEIAVGYDDFLRKPFQEHEVFELLHKHLGLRFVYEGGERSTLNIRHSTSNQALTPEALAALPDELLENLEHAVTVADINSIVELIEEVRTFDNIVADALSSLVKDFAYAEILTALQQFQRA